MKVMKALLSLVKYNNNINNNINNKNNHENNDSNNKMCLEIDR